MCAWQFAKAQHIAEKNGWTKFISMQNCYNVKQITFTTNRNRIV